MTANHVKIEVESFTKLSSQFISVLFQSLLQLVVTFGGNKNEYASIFSKIKQDFHSTGIGVEMPYIMKYT